MHIKMSAINTMALVRCNDIDTKKPNSKNSNSESNRKKRKQALQLSKIRTEIEALGDIEIEITHV